MKPKIICIGFEKTGTTSLEQALTILGYRVRGNYPRALLPAATANKKKLLKILEGYDAMSDKPWFMIYRELDQLFPGSTFILTVREEESWYRSVSRHLGSLRTAHHEWIYGKGKGVPRDNKENAIKVFSQHNREVKEYFSNRPEDLLVLNLAEDNNWEKLCQHVDKPIPAIPFPHLMKGANNIQTEQSLSKQFKYIRRKIKNYFLIRYMNMKGLL
ncbi:MAG: sulfotransferase family protein [Bacteroidota bacterium]